MVKDDDNKNSVDNATPTDPTIPPTNTTIITDTDKNDIDDDATSRKQIQGNEKKRRILQHWSIVPLLCLIYGVAILVRIGVGSQPHSGQDNYQGPNIVGFQPPSSQPSHSVIHKNTIDSIYGGDYEAQRHWMELTWHLPIKDWYWYKLDYWGLDYPPLSAYISWIGGALSHSIVGPNSVALQSSQGYENIYHKVYMRTTVFLLDFCCYGTIVYYWTGLHTITSITTTPSATTTTQTKITMIQSAWIAVIALLQPSIILIDHGHFQYNTVALGLSLWGFYYMTQSSFYPNCIIGSIFFCLALSFKQMTLYYAPAVFFYLLGRCWAEPKILRVMTGILSLGGTVLLTFAIHWWPFFLYGGPPGTTYTHRAMHMFRRIFPLQRGLFEGKVSNLWCALSVRPIRLRHRIPEVWQPLCALGLTILFLLPVCYYMFVAGKGYMTNPVASVIQQRQLLWGVTSSALSFFLASFQVHEKSLLLALAPCTFLLPYDTVFVEWFSLITAWTLWPLLQIDRLQLAYICTVGIFVIALRWRRHWQTCNNHIASPIGFFDSRPNDVRWLIPSFSYILMLLLHILEYVVTVPDHLPDLFPVLWSIVGCGFCCLAWFITCWRLWGIEQEVSKLLQRRPKKTHRQ